MNLKYVNEIDNAIERDDDYVSDTDEDKVVGTQTVDSEDVYIPETDETIVDDQSTIWKERHLAPYSNGNLPFQGNTNFDNFVNTLQTPAALF